MEINSLNGNLLQIIFFALSPSSLSKQRTLHQYFSISPPLTETVTT